MSHVANPLTTEQRLAAARAALHDALTAAEHANPKDSAARLYDRCNRIWGLCADGYVASGGTLSSEQAQHAREITESNG